MDFEIWWLIVIPLLFGLGWIAARVDIRQMLSENRHLPDSYFKGLNFLLNEDHDQAIDAFIEVAKLDPETTELHFALGSLFRRRGEIERAIRVHHNLLQRSDLPSQQREQALHELAQDYLRAGLLDRAEEAFNELKATRYAPEALSALIKIHETERNWPAAIQTVQQLKQIVDQPVPQAVHFHCEEAAQAMETGALAQAHAALDAATNEGQSHVRVLMMRADLARHEGNQAEERAALERLFVAHPDYAGLCAPVYLENCEQTGEALAGLQRLRAVYAEHPSLDLFHALFQGTQAQQGLSQALAFARGALKNNPSLLGLDYLLEAQAEVQGGAAQPQAADIEAGQEAFFVSSPENAAMMRGLIYKHKQRLNRYACQACGFKAQRFHWQCPGCNAWETYLPKRLEELDV